MKFSEKMCLIIILKVTKQQGFTLCLEDAIFEKSPGGDQFDPPPSHPPPVLGLRRLTNIRIQFTPLN